jgi:hypothetical protein
MPTQDSYEYYIGWTHEKNRAIDLGKPNYEANCQIEIDRLVALEPTWAPKKCACGEFTGCTGPE